MIKFSILLIAFCLLQIKVCYRKNINYIVNGDFQDTTCRSESEFCIFYTNSSVPEWLVFPQIQVGYGFVYNYRLQQYNRVAELDPDKNTCIRQYFPTYIKKGVLKFIRTARQAIPFQSCKFVVKINDVIILDITPTDYEIHKEKVKFQIDDRPQESWVQFCGTGTSDRVGPVIDKVQLYARKYFQESNSTIF